MKNITTYVGVDAHRGEQGSIPEPPLLRATCGFDQLRQLRALHVTMWHTSRDVGSDVHGLPERSGRLIAQPRLHPRDVGLVRHSPPGADPGGGRREIDVTGSAHAFLRGDSNR